MTSIKTTKAVIYCRVASVQSGRLTDALRAQEMRARSYASLRGYEVMEVYRDHASGAAADRPGLEAMTSALVEPGHDGWVVIVDDASRIARDIGVFWVVRDAVHAAGVLIETASITPGGLEFRA